MNRYKISLIILVLAISVNAKSQTSCDFIQSIQNYQDSVRLKQIGENDIIDSNTFNINKYLSYFDHIEVNKGFNISVYFFDNFLDGNPYLYAIKENEELNDKDKKSLFEFLNKKENRAKNHIKPSDSENGFLQYLFFSEMGEQFALKWHSNYKNKYIICSQKKLDEIVNEFRKNSQTESNDEEIEEDFSVNDQELKKFELLDPTIKFESQTEYYIVTWFENRTHSGIYQCSYKIQRQAPYEIELINEKQLLKISIGFLY